MLEAAQVQPKNATELESKVAHLNSIDGHLCHIVDRLNALKRKLGGSREMGITEKANEPPTLVAPGLISELTTVSNSINDRGHEIEEIISELEGMI